MKMKPAALAALICAGVFVVFALLGLGVWILYDTHGRHLGFSFGNFSGWGLGPVTEYTVDETREALPEGITRVFISDLSCPIALVSGGDRITARLAGDCAASGDPLTLEMSTQRGTLTFDVKYPDTGLRRNDCSLTITLPESFAGALEIQNVSGEIDAAELRGTLDAVQIQTVSGGCHFPHVGAGSVDFDSVSGGLEFTGAITGRLEANTISGSIRADRVAGPIEAETVSGSVTLTVDRLDEINCESTSGHVTLHLPSDAAFSLDFHTVSGRLGNDFPIVITSGGSSRGDIAGEVAGGGTRIRIETVSGSADIRRRS